MPRSFPSNLQAIFSDYAKDIDYLLDITFPVIAPLHVSTGETVKDLIDYDNDISSVGQIRQTAGAVIDTVEITVEDKRENFSQHFADNPFEWIRAEGVLYRRYYKFDGSAFFDAEVFRGSIENPNDDDGDATFSFQLMPDTISRGNIVASRTLSDVCPFIFKDPKTCAYTGTETHCDHLLKSDCTKYANTHHFGGMQAYANPVPVPPGGGGGGDNGGGGSGGGFGGGGGGGGGQCPTLDQFVLVRGLRGEVCARKVRNVTVGTYLLNPITNKFERVKSAEIFTGAKVFVVTFANGTMTKASASHPLIRGLQDTKGLPIEQAAAGQTFLTHVKGEVWASEIVSIIEVESQPVMKIETEGKTHIYASGAAKNKMAVCHNNKDPFDEFV